jgi:hypothetical protein
MGIGIPPSSLQQSIQSPYAEDFGKPQQLEQQGSPEGDAQNRGLNSAFGLPDEAGKALSALSQEMGGAGATTYSNSPLEQPSQQQTGGNSIGSELKQLVQLLKQLLLQGSGPAGGGVPAPTGGGDQGGSGGTGPLSAPSPQSAASGPPGVSGAAAPSSSGALGLNVPSALKPFVQDINAAAKQTGVPASLIGAQILQESGGNPNAVTTNPALGLPDTGLMQVDQKTFQGLQKDYPDLLGGKSVSDPATNIMAGALLDAQLLKQNNGNTSAALTAYNGNATSGYANDVTAKMTALQNGTPVPGGFS